MSLEKRLVACNNCSWLHMEVSREFAENAVKEFNDYYNNNAKARDFWNSPASLNTYEQCNHCGQSYKNFREAYETDGPKSGGFTIGPIINKGE